MALKQFEAGKQPVEFRKLSAEVTGTGTVVTGKTVFCGLLVTTDGTNDVTITLYDNTSAAGTKLMPGSPVFKGSDNIGGIEFDKGILAEIGIHIVISVAGGGSCTIQIIHDQG